MSEPNSLNSGRPFNIPPPNATPLVLDEAALFPNGRGWQFKLAAIGAWTSPDDFKTIAATLNNFFKQQGYRMQPHDQWGAHLSGRGLPYTVSRHMYGHKNGQVAEVNVFSPAAVKIDSALHIVKVLAASVPAGHTLVFYSYGSSSTRPDPGFELTKSRVTVTTDMVMYVGPDRRLHPATPTGLVMKQPSNEVSTSFGTALRVEWLISDDQSTWLAVRQRNDERSSYEVGIGPVGILTDEFGHTCELYAAGDDFDFTMLSESFEMMRGPSLPGNVRQLTFNPGPENTYILNDVMTVEVVPFSQAKLPQAVAFPQAVADVRGIAVSVPFAYFGPDFTLLAAQQDSTVYRTQIKETTGMLVGPERGFELDMQHTSITDDRGGHVLQQGFRQRHRPRGMYASNINLSLLELPPLASDATSLTINIHEQPLTMMVADPRNLAPDAPGLIVPVAELIRTGATQTGTVFEVSEFKLRIIELSARYDAVRQEATIRVTVQPDMRPTSEGAVLMGGSLQYLGPESLGVIGGGRSSIGVEIGYSPSTEELEKLLSSTAEHIIRYDSSLSEIKLTLTSLSYELPGPWVFTLPVVRPT